ncbi:MAG TPA: LysR family transcriptional regulator [Burkholderiales bacterium]
MKSDIKTLGRRIDLNLLVVFEAIYKARNLGAAGQTIGLSQPAMSHALARLRSLFKDPLFVRLPRGLQPTPYADTIAPTVAQGITAIRGVFDEAGFDPASSKRVFRIAMTDLGERIFLPSLCAHLAKVAPAVSVETCQPSIKELREAMASGEIDLSTGVIPSLEAGFRQQILTRSAYVCVVREGHPKIRDALTLRQFREASHVLVAANPSTAIGHAETIERALRAPGVNARIALRNAHFLALPGIVLNTDFVATLPKGLAASFQEHLKVRVFPPPVPLPGFEIKLYWHDRYHREPGNKWLRGVFAELFRK